MKLIIDIDEDDYNNIEPFLNGETIKGGFNLFKVLEMIKNGIPLDDLRAEIMQLDYDIEYVDYDYNDMAQTEMVHTICREEVLRIIDKYRNEVSE